MHDVLNTDIKSFTGTHLSVNNYGYVLFVWLFFLTFDVVKYLSFCVKIIFIDYKKKYYCKDVLLYVLSI